MSTLCMVLLMTTLSSSAYSSLKDRRLVLENDMDRGECPCGDIYTVRDGETLQIVSTKCHAPLILVDNPHVQDSDDVSPGSLLKITCLPSLA